MSEHRSRSYWSKLVKRYEARAAVETQESFAARHHVNVGTFRSWLYKLRREGQSIDRVRFVEVEPTVMADRGRVEVELDDHRIRVCFVAGEPAERIAEVIAAVLARAAC